MSRSGAALRLPPTHACQSAAQNCHGCGTSASLASPQAAAACAAVGAGDRAEGNQLEPPPPAAAARKTKAKSVRIESPRGEGGEGAALPEDEACRRLVGLLCDCCPPALGQLGRMVPPALVERRLERPPPELVNEFGQR